MKSRAQSAARRSASKSPAPKSSGAKVAATPPLDFDMLLANARQASELLKALSHEVRLLILCFLIEGEKSVGEIEKMLNLRQPAVSQQLARLRADGLVETRRNGKSIYYSLARSEVRDVIAVLHDAFCKPRKTR
ncbi:MAG: metalloregulator ArsR/SmtB family transcription factor [Xanthobacteraceae bacterium]|nr:metalloregulator ArsR/SmtB family transcription factor [Xanthobacteraceae bacterium]